MNKGFTLIELLITVAIIGILSLMALPLYKDYINRSYIAEGIIALGQHKIGIQEAAYTGDQVGNNADVYNLYNEHFFDMPNGHLLSTWGNFYRYSSGRSFSNVQGFMGIGLNTQKLWGFNGDLSAGGVIVQMSLSYYFVKPSTITKTTSNGYTYLTLAAQTFADADNDEGWTWVCGVDNYFIQTIAEARQNLSSIMSAFPAECRNILDQRS